MVTVAKVNDKGSPGSEVPTVTVALAYALLLASLVILVLYVHHAGQSLRVAGLIDLVGDNLHLEIDRLFPVERSPEVGAEIVTAPDAGVVVMIDVEGLVEQARRLDGCLEMLVGIGDFVPRDGPILRCRGTASPDPRTIRRMVLLDNERSHVGDAAYGLRKLVDIAERSIASSPYNDPMTAVQAIDRLHDGLRQLCFRRLPADTSQGPRWRPAAGHPRARLARLRHARVRGTRQPRLVVAARGPSAPRRPRRPCRSRPG